MVQCEPYVYPTQSSATLLIYQHLAGNYHLTRHDGIEVTEDMARAVLEEFGELERVHFPSETEIVIFNLGRGPLVTFVNYQGGREALNVSYVKRICQFLLTDRRSFVTLMNGTSKPRSVSVIRLLSNPESRLSLAAVSLPKPTSKITTSTDALSSSPTSQQILRSLRSMTFLTAWVTLSTSPLIVAHPFVRVCLKHPFPNLY